MRPFCDFLTEYLAIGTTSAEDALAAFLPLARQVAALHQADQVAPLRGLDALRAVDGQLGFDPAAAQPPSLANERVAQVELPDSRAVDIVGRLRVDVDIDSGARTDSVDLTVGRPGDPIERPVYLPGYVAWEHEVGCHDPLADLFSLGLVFASLAVRLDLRKTADLERFVQARGNLFALAPKLHPVLAKAIVRMTELERARRPRDLASLVRTLENYRDHEVDLETDLAQSAQASPAPSAAPPSRRALILGCLRRRLFDVSRRNRLLHFRATNQTVNLTWASMPLAFRPGSLQPDDLLTWNERFASAVASGKPIALNRWLRFEEAIYLPSLLDGIRVDAYRDQAEFGVAQLRLVVCFLRWANLKETPAQRFDSPLVLLPVRLTKTKGVRDVFSLEPLAAEAEINPALRHLLQTLYAVELPETINLQTDTLESLYERIRTHVEASEPGVTVEKIDKPRMQLIHAQARRRVDQYRNRARAAAARLGQTPPETPAPLALPSPESATPELIEPTPTPAPTPEPEAKPVASANLITQAESESNPYRWEFDLCSVTLGNFNYRKMSLVRDYSALLERDADHPGFDALFAAEPRPASEEAPPPLPWDERFPVVPHDGTQASAVALARAGRSFIIQGPPGSGKSQTITNLIADAVARGQRVLFVCEKRAALDVVHHRLSSTGLDVLACLVHDSQNDKKALIQNLKTTYEDLLEGASKKRARAAKERERVSEQIQRELAALERVRQFHVDAPARAGEPVRDLLDRVARAPSPLPTLGPRERDLLPDHAVWLANQERVARLGKQLDPFDSPLATHPLRWLHPRYASESRPLERIESDLASARRQLDALVPALEAIDAPPAPNRSLADWQALAAHAETLRSLAEHDVLALADPKSDLAKKWAQRKRSRGAAAKKVDEAARAAAGWRTKLARDDATRALAEAERLEQVSLRFLRPSWWRLRRLLNGAYDFSRHASPVGGSTVLRTLIRWHETEAALRAFDDASRSEFAFEGEAATFDARLAEIAQAVERLPPGPAEAHRLWIASADGADQVRRLAALRTSLDSLQAALANLVLLPSDLPLVSASAELDATSAGLDGWAEFLPCLREIAALPPALADAARRLPHPLDRLEPAAARRTAEDLFRDDPDVRRASAAVQEKQAQQVSEAHADWLRRNADTILERARDRFLENVRISQASASELTPEQKEFKPRYHRGRRELEHEFGKTMRFRSIRDLVASDAGLVLRDLKPIWLMSPLSVSDTLPLADAPFDVVIFDEASQVTLEEAVPALYRAQQTLVVGDEKQLPPTRFFASRSADDESEASDEAIGDDQELGADSLLNHAARKLPATMLRWHYRSRSESLIAFSNASFYQGRLLTVPDVRTSATQREPIRIAQPSEAAANVDRLLDRPVSFHFVESGVYAKRRNAAEADVIAHLVRGLLRKNLGLSLGVIAFSQAQQTEIEDALTRLAASDDAFSERLEAERQREEDGQFVGLLVKNLENIQGDERDVILLSVCYGPGLDGRMLMNFGPINQTGGERRLNVAFSRARKQMAVVSSIRADRIVNDYNLGARTLKNYLRYAEALSQGDPASARRALCDAPTARAASESAAAPAFAAALSAALVERGFQVEADVGESDFRVDLALRRPGAEDYCLGILLDGARHFAADDPFEREVFRPELLRSFGWPIVRCRAADWFHDPSATLAALDAALAPPEKKPRKRKDGA